MNVSQVGVLSGPGPQDKYERARIVRDTFLSRRKASTLETYTKALRVFAAWLRATSDVDAIAILLIAGEARRGGANGLVERYAADLRSRVAPATVNVRLSALRSAVRLARRMGYIAWNLEVEGERVQRYRDTSGPGANAVARILATCDNDAIGLRDRAVLRVLYDRALRRAEALGLDLSDVELAGARVAVLGKGQTGKEWLTIPRPTVQALAEWIAVRGRDEGPLFVRLDRGRGTVRSRLTGEGLRRMIERRARLADIEQRVRPHGLRHTAITEALDRVGDIRKVQAFSRHADRRTLQRYDDSRRDFGGEVAAVVAAGV